MPRTSIAHLQTYLSTGALRLHLVGANYTRVGMVKDPVSGLYLHGITMEPERIQLSPQSRAHDSWTPNNCSVTPTNATAPDGTATADVIHEDATAGAAHSITAISAAAFAAGTTYIMTSYVKAMNRGWDKFLVVDIAGGNHSCCFNVTTGAIGTSAGCTPLVSQSVGNYFRVGMAFTHGDNAARNVYHYVLSGDNSPVFNGLNQDSLQVWGTQVEAGAYPSSQIINDGVGSVTRTADTATIHILGNEMAEKRGCLTIPVLMTKRTPAADTSMFSIYKSGAAATDHITGWIEQTTGYFKVTSAASGKSAGSLSVAKNIADGNVHHLCIAWRDGTIVAWVDTATSAADLDAGVAPDLNRWDYKACGGWVGGPQVTFPDVIPGTPPRYVQPVWSQS